MSDLKLLVICLKFQGVFIIIFVLSFIFSPDVKHFKNIYKTQHFCFVPFHFAIFFSICCWFHSLLIHAPVPYVHFAQLPFERGSEGGGGGYFHQLSIRCAIGG